MNFMDESTFSDLGELTDEEWVLLRSLRILNIEIQWLSGLCPVQAEGLAHNLPFYFRARGSHWTFSLDETPEPEQDNALSVACGFKQGFELYHEYGEIPEAGYMPVSHVLAFIGYAVAEWRSERSI